ncbi:FAD-dependent oxidoreductase [Dasania marina]|uniref:FAD-dependent oxidoreductase n=1 Tax=Dasania marina TaxID=471499 RepID=UPI003B8307ED
MGGGFSGIEAAGELRDLLNEACKYYKNVEPENCRVLILHGTDRLLPEISDQLGKKTEKIFKKSNIEVHFNTRAERI